MKSLIIVSLLFSFSSAFAQIQMSRESSALGTLITATNNLAATDLSCANDSDCDVLEYGSMACGGPQGGIVVSKKNLNLAEVEMLAHQTVVRTEAFNRKWKVIGICMAPLIPTPSCIKRICQ